MRFRTLVAAGLGAGLAVAPALAEDGYRHGRVRFVESGVILQRASEVSAEEALANVPFLPGDRVWTDSAGRAEFQFPDGTVVRLDRRSKLDYAGHEEGESERIVLRLWSGSVLVRVRTREFARFEVETPAGMVRALDRGIVRVDVEAGQTRLSVYAGEAELDDGRGRTRLAAGERTYVRWGGEAEEPQRFDPAEEDDFARWDDTRESEDRWAARSSEYLPDQLDPYAGEFEANGHWGYEGAVGFVWYPSVAVGWQPYANGRWEWTPYGWTWIPYERWGWAPFHYGRWGFSASMGWYWMPGSIWGPAWVSWAVGGGYVGWCPLGWHNRPVAPWHDRGHTGPRGRYGRHDPWNVVRRGDLGARDIGRRRISPEQIDSGALRVADTPELRPTRDGGNLREGGTAPRAITRRMSPGDFVRELGPDNKTTIPAPWTHGYGPPPAGVDGARYGVPRRTDQGDDKPSRSGTTNRGTGAVAAPATGAPTGSSGQADDRAASSPRRAARPAPWYAPSTPESSSPDRGGRAVPPSGDGARRRGADDGYRSRPPDGTFYRPRSGGGESSGGYSRPRSGGGSESSGGYRAPGSSGASSGGYRAPSGSGGSSGGAYRPSGSGGGQSSGSYRAPSSGGASSGGGARARSSGGSSGGSSGSNHAARPRSNRN